VFGIDRYSLIQVKLTKISYIGTLFKVQYIQDSSLLRVRFRKVSLYHVVSPSLSIIIHHADSTSLSLK